MMYIEYKTPNGDVQIDKYPDSYIVKVLQSGTMQIRRPVIADVPDMGDQEAEMAVAKELTVAVYSSRTEFTVKRIAP